VVLRLQEYFEPANQPAFADHCGIVRLDTLNLMADLAQRMAVMRTLAVPGVGDKSHDRQLRWLPCCPRGSPRPEASGGTGHRSISIAAHRIADQGCGVKTAPVPRNTQRSK